MSGGLLKARMSNGDTAVATDNELSAAIAGFLGVSRDELGSIANDHVIAKHILKRAKDLDELQSNNVKLHATIDEMKMLCSKKVDFLTSKVDSLTKSEESAIEAEAQLQEQVSQLIAEKKLITDELDSTRSDLQNFKDQKDGLVTSRQDAVKLLDEKVTELEASKKETEELLKENKELRHRILEVENETQNYRCKELSERSEMEVIKQQAALLDKSNKWLENEVVSKTEKFIKYRQDNDAELQRSLKDVAILKSELQVEKSSREYLTTKNHELSQDLQAKLLEIKSLGDTLNTERQEFSREMSLKQKLIDLLEEQVNSLQKEVRLISDSKESRAGEESSLNRTELEDDLIKTKQRLEAAEHECLRLEAVVREVLGNGDEEKDTSSSPQDLSLSKAYGDLGVLKKQLIKERHQKETLQRQVESFIVELEYKIPFINSLKDRTSALEKELNDAALLLEHTSIEKDKTARELEAAVGKIKQYESNISTLVRQRSDLAHQVQFLLVNVSVHNDSRGPLTEDETAFIKRLIENEDLSGDSDSQKVITERLLEFKDIGTLQERNAELLKTVRNLAANLEEEERKNNSKIDSLESETIKEAKEAIVILQDYNTKLESRIEIIAKERDAFRTILEERHDSKQETHTGSDKSVSNNREALIKELEARLSNLSSESSKNIQMLNDEIQNLLKIKTDVTIDLEKERSSKVLAEERLRLLQGTLDTVKKENSELLKSSHDLQDIISSQEAKSTETMSKYVSCKSKLSVLESKINHLEAERAILQEANSSMKSNMEKITDEKNSLKIVIAQLQTLQSEREDLLKETHTSYKSKLDQLERNMEKLTSKVVSKEEELKMLEQTRNSQITWYQERLDAIGDEAKQLRDEAGRKAILVSQLETQAKSLTKRLEKLEGQPMLKDTSSKVLVEDSNEEQLQHRLEKIQLQLTDAYSQIDQYKELSLASEESWKVLSAEFDRAKQDFNSEKEKLMSDKLQQESEINRLKENIDFLNNTYAAQKNKSEEEKHALQKRLISLEGEQNAMEGLKIEFKQKIAQFKVDLEQQVSYANVAQSNYEEELRRHAEVTKTLSQLRTEIEAKRLEALNVKASEQQARELLEANEKNWFNEKAEYEKDLELHRNRIEDLSTQNKLLFNQIELFSNCRQEANDEIHSDSRDLLTSLRRERDILETKLTVSKREEKVLRQRQLALEDELSELRKKALKLQTNDSDQAALAKQHSEVLEQLNQMNLLRESNITLRNAAESARVRNVELEKELTDLRSKVVPLECEVENCHKSIKEREQEIRVFHDEAERWKARSHDILSRQEKIDPEEFKNLEDQVNSLQKQLEERVKEKNDLDDRFNRLKKQAHEKLNASKTAQTALNSELSDVTSIKTKLEETLKEQQARVAELEKVLSEKNDKSDTITDLRSKLEDAAQKVKEIEGKLLETTSSSEGVISQLNAEIANLKQQINTMNEAGKGNVEPNKTESDLSSIVESMKKAFEEEKISFMRDIQREYSERLEEEKAKISSNAPTPLQSEDMSELKKKWEQSQEESVKNRIKEAEENLKKRIRMPTEERINKVLEKRKAELEEEYQRKLNQNLAQTTEGNESAEGNVRKELDKEYESKYEEILASVKKKAFEEGKQQASMKSTLLERKISKLEALLNKSSQSKSEAVSSTVSSSMPSKIDEVNGKHNAANQFPVSAEKVLKLAERPSSEMLTLQTSNPFTSGSSMSNNALEMKPAFTFPVSSKKEADSSSAADTSNRTVEGDVPSSQPQQHQQIEKEVSSEAPTIDIRDATREMNAESPLKRPADSQFNNGSSPKREKQDSSPADN